MLGKRTCLVLGYVEATNGVLIFFAVLSVQFIIRHQALTLRWFITMINHQNCTRLISGIQIIKTPLVATRYSRTENFPFPYYSTPIELTTRCFAQFSPNLTGQRLHWVIISSHRSFIIQFLELSGYRKSFDLQRGFLQKSTRSIFFFWIPIGLGQTFCIFTLIIYILDFFSSFKNF